MTIGCGKPIELNLWWRKCGDHFAGNKLLCPDCEAYARYRYPQGWKSYPGDMCEHGVYVGGCAEDLMCIYCENEQDPQGFKEHWAKVQRKAWWDYHTYLFTELYPRLYVEEINLMITMFCVGVTIGVIILRFVGWR